VLAAMVFAVADAKHRQTVIRDQKACDAGVAESCWAVGKIFEDGELRPRDPVRAHALYQKACDDGEQKGCVWLGIAYKYGGDVPQSYERALNYYRQACTGSSGLGCYDAGQLLETGKVGPEDIPGAIALYRQGAERGYSDASKALERFGAGQTPPVAAP
jgi:TPR repeat protein